MGNIFSYDESKGFEVRHCRTNNSIFNGIGEDSYPFEIRIRHLDPEMIQVLKEKVLEWIG